MYGSDPEVLRLKLQALRREACGWHSRGAGIGVIRGKRSARGDDVPTDVPGHVPKQAIGGPGQSKTISEVP